MITDKDILKYKPLVYKISQRFLTNELTLEDKEDIIQVGFLMVYKSLQKYNDSFKVPFINYVSLNIARAMYKEKKKILKKSNECSIDDYNFIGIDTTNNIDKEIFNNDYIIKVFKAIRRLNTNIINKQILTLKILGYSNIDIAKRLNIKKTKVADSIANYKQKLINKLNGGR